MKRLALIAALALPFLALGAQATAIVVNAAVAQSFRHPVRQFSVSRRSGTAEGAEQVDVERVYFTFRMPAGDRGSIRITTDLFQQTTSGSDSYYKGWVLRAKYAYFQYDYSKSAN